MASPAALPTGRPPSMACVSLKKQPMPCAARNSSSAGRSWPPCLNIGRTVGALGQPDGARRAHQSAACSSRCRLAAGHRSTSRGSEQRQIAVGGRAGDDLDHSPSSCSCAKRADRCRPGSDHERRPASGCTSRGKSLPGRLRCALVLSAQSAGCPPRRRQSFHRDRAQSARAPVGSANCSVRTGVMPRVRRAGDARFAPGHRAH